MTTSDPQQILDRIKARAAEATPGPWEARENTVAAITGTGDCGGCSGILSPAHEPSCYWSQIAEAGAEDAEFIAHARTDVDRLTEALEAVLALHVERWAPNPIPGGFICDACREPVESEPCTTVRAIEAKLNQEDQG